MDSGRAAHRLVFGALLVFASAAPLLAADGEKLSLEGQRRTGETTRVEVTLQVGGDLKLVTDGKPKTLPMSCVANLKYDEQVLAVDAGQRPIRSVRFYDEARAVIKVDQGGEKPALDEGRRLIGVVKTDKASPMLFCPTAGLKREELDLIDVPSNTLIIDRLLPEKPVSLGESWKLADETLAELLSLEAVSWSDVSSVLNQVADGLAEVTIGGSVSGAVGGVSSELEIKAKYRFDMSSKRVVYLALLIKEKRAVGHIGPGLDTVAKLMVKISPVEQSQHLTETLVKTVPREPGAEYGQLSYASPGGKFRFLYDRRWFLTTDDAKLSVFRLLDRGELVAQCNVSELPHAPTKLVTLPEFQKDVQNSLGKNFGKFVNASQFTSQTGYSVLRAVVQGNVAQLPIEWIYYLVIDPRGHRVSLAFTMEETLHDRFGQADRVLVNSLRMPDDSPPVAAKPTAAAAVTASRPPAAAPASPPRPATTSRTMQPRPTPAAPQATPQPTPAPAPADPQPAAAPPAEAQQPTEAQPTADAPPAPPTAVETTEPVEQK